MAHLRTPSNLAVASVASIPGITTEDVEELRVLGIMSVQALMGQMDATGGNLQDLSNDHAVIEPEQAKRIGDALLAFDRVPEGWKNRWTSSTPALAPPPVVPPTPTPVAPSMWTRIKEAWAIA